VKGTGARARLAVELRQVRRTLRGVTQRDLAQAAGIARTRVQQAEDEEGVITWATVQVYLEACWSIAEGRGLAPVRDLTPFWGLFREVDPGVAPGQPTPASAVTAAPADGSAAGQEARLVAPPMRAGALVSSSSLLVLVLVTFLLPFVSESCRGYQLASVTGVDLALGVDLRQPNWNAPALGLRAGHLGPDPWTLAVWLLPAVGLAIVWLGWWRHRRVVAAVLGVVGVAGEIGLARLLLRIDAANQVVQRSSYGTGRLDPGPGLVVAIVLFGILVAWGAWCTWRWTRPRRERGTAGHRERERGGEDAPGRQESGRLVPD
jgi:hypothetical protein